ncbi:uracil-xanthine permease family protein [Agrilactobacillus yilanensis]|uniref:Uracil-xanthine permease family protein n=1 Tax=Agrilactobacillus yilanensis TaxID=2485997 RepID=A0ABW4J535_9LACO|nr:solute carrier family 23 protein [Agrilactobacillus yilanensis]
MNASKVKVCPADEKIPLHQSIPLGFQHTIIAILGSITVPLIVSASVGLTPQQTIFFVSAVIFSGGIATILASLNVIPRTSPLLPMVMGANFAVASVIVVTLKNATSINMGFRLVAGATIVAGVFCFLIAPFWMKLRRFFPPLVVGTNLMVLGVALLPNTYHWIMASNAHHQTARVNHGALMLALGVFVFHLLVSKYLKGFLGDLSILLALVLGTVVAAFMGLVNFQPVQDAPWFSLILPFHYGLPKFDLTVIISFVIVMILSMVAVSGTSMGIHNIVGKEMTDMQFGKTMKTLGLVTLIAGFFNGVQNTAFVENVGILELAKKKSRYATAAAGIILVGIGLTPKFSALISVVPKPVLGGVGFALFGVVIGSAANILKQVDLKAGHNMLIVGISIGMCMLPAVYPNFYANYPTLIQNIFGSGILAGALTSITLNIFFNWKTIMGTKTVAKAEKKQVPMTDEAVVNHG